MKRQVNLNEISDGRLYGLNDMVKADCQDCNGCSACCCGMGNSIVLDPMDVYRLTGGLNRPFEVLLQKEIELNVVDGIILPNLKMMADQDRCSFLNHDGRCLIHQYRPGICRLFPLGRLYSEDDFQYFLQIYECRQESRTKVKVKKWIDTPDPRQYEDYINAWHNYLMKCQEKAEQGMNQQSAKVVSMVILSEFYIKPYDLSVDFYQQFYERLSNV